VVEQTPLAFEPVTLAEPAVESAPAPVPLPVEEETVEAVVSSPAAEPALAPVPVVAPPVQVEEVVASAPEPTVSTEPVPAPVSMPTPVKPQVDISVALQETGLVMVETSRDKAPISIPTEPEIRLGRKPKATVVVSSEPLNQVETHK
jgi:ribonuclease E